MKGKLICDSWLPKDLPVEKTNEVLRKVIERRNAHLECLKQERVDNRTILRTIGNDILGQVKREEALRQLLKKEGRALRNEAAEISKKLVVKARFSENSGSAVVVVTNGTLGSAETRIEIDEQIETADNAASNLPLSREIDADEVAESIFRNYLEMATKRMEAREKAKEKTSKVFKVLKIILTVIMVLGGVANVTFQVIMRHEENARKIPNLWEGPAADFDPELHVYLGGKDVNWQLLPDDVAFLIEGFRTAMPNAPPIDEITKVVNYVLHACLREQWDMRSTIARLLDGGATLQPPNIPARRRDLEAVLSQAIVALRQMEWPDINISMHHWLNVATAEKQESAKETLGARPRTRRASEQPQFMEPNFGDISSFRHGKMYASNQTAYRKGLSWYQSIIKDLTGSNAPVDLIPTDVCENLGGAAPLWVGQLRAVPPSEQITKIMEHLNKRVSTNWKIHTLAVILWQSLASQKNDRVQKEVMAETAKERAKNVALSSQVRSLQNTCDALSSRRTGDEETIEAMSVKIHDLKQDSAKAEARAKTLESQLGDARNEIEDLVAQNKEQNQEIRELKKVCDDKIEHLEKVKHVIRLFDESDDSDMKPVNLTDLEHPSTEGMEVEEQVAKVESSAEDSSMSVVALDESGESGIHSSLKSTPDMKDKAGAPKKKIGPPGLRCTGGGKGFPVGRAIESTPRNRMTNAESAQAWGTMRSFRSYLEDIKSVVEDVDSPGSSSTVNISGTGEADESSGDKGQEEVQETSGLEGSDDDTPSRPKRPRSPSKPSRDRGQDRKE